ncbi:MAG: hypothetical protein KOO62_03500 [candidate division Zixibacteria bacterium]|nr:hypothetical protein [candidate division Zixibacteria bacterium]
MLKASSIILTALCLTITANSNTFAGVEVGLSIDSDGIKSFHLAIGEHYQIPEKEVVAVRKKSLSDEELVVVFFLAEHANVKAGVILNLRSKGKSWWEITHYFGLNPDIFFLALKTNPGPPYGKAYGHFKKAKKHRWKNISLADVDIVNCVNLRFVTQRHGYSPDEVIRLRHQGHKFARINAHAKHQMKEKRKHKQMSKASGHQKPHKGKGKKKK